MRWPTGAMSLLGRACGLNPGRTYKLLRLLREHSGFFLRKLWQLSLDRRRETNDVAARGKVREDWGETKRRLGTMGRDGRGKLMPSWSAVAKMPLCKVRAQLKRWNRVNVLESCEAVSKHLRGLSCGVREW